MIPDELRKKLQNIVDGAILEGRHDSCTAVRNLLCRSFGTSPTVKSEFQNKSILKEKQARFRELLTFNGFENIKRQDYYNSELGLLLEDMHDENVIARDNHLFFIDTVFYIMQK